MFGYKSGLLAFLPCFGQRVRVRIAPATPVENCIEEFSELLETMNLETMNCASMDGILCSPLRRLSQTSALKMNCCSHHHIGRCITPHNFLVATCQSRGGLCRKKLHPACQAQTEHDMNVNDVPTMMMCANCLRRVAGDQWNDEAAAGIIEENEVGIAAAGSAGILADAITIRGAWRSDRAFNTCLRN